MEPEGVVRIPEPERGSFAEGEAIDVVAHGHHLGLWKEWRRVKRSASASRGKVARRSDFEAASQRLRRAAADAFFTDPSDRKQPARDPATGLYLMGLAVECRLKVLICDCRRVGDLAKAGFEAARERGAEVDVLGGQGHDLELLLELADLKHLMGEQGFCDDWLLFVNRWTVGWRYGLPEDVARQRDAFFTAFQGVLVRLDKEVTR